MPSAVQELVKRRVIQQWISGVSRDKIAEENNIGAGTVSSIINGYKTQMEKSDLGSVRELAVEANKQGLSLRDLSSLIRLYNYFRDSGATEEEIELFIAKVCSGDIPKERVVEYVNQIYEIVKGESIPLHEVPSYIKQKLEEKQRIEEQIQEVDAVLQSRKVSIEAINEHIKLNEELEKHGLSADNVHKLLSVLINAKRYGFDEKEIAEKLYDFKFLEWKEKELKDKHKKLSKRMSKLKDIIPYTEEIVSLRVGIQELLGLEVAIKEAAKMYNLPFYSSTVRLIDDIKTLNKINGVKKELQRLSLQKYVLDQACSRQSQSLVNLAKLKSYGLTEDRILQLNSFLEDNVYKASSYAGPK